jgi:hypothetical protein
VSPLRFELSQHRDFGYRVSVPNLLPNPDDRLLVREDIITEEDVAAVAKHLAEIDRGDGAREYTTGYEDEARQLLSLVLGSGKEGEDA